MYRSRATDCCHCQLRRLCLNEHVKSRSIIIRNGYEALLRARRRHREPDKKFRKTYGRHRYQVEGMHGEAKTQHGLRRAVRRGLANVSIQAYLTATVINLKRLAAFYLHFLGQFYVSDHYGRLLISLYLQILYYCNNYRRNYLLAQ